jgi:Arc/MetJ-type ribon-helix-helix transcriptional regulator
MAKPTVHVDDELLADTDDFVEQSTMFSNRSQFVKYCLREQLQKHAE